MLHPMLYELFFIGVRYIVHGASAETKTQKNFHKNENGSLASSLGKYTG